MKDKTDKARLLREQKRREGLLRELKQRKHSCRPKDAEAALEAWSFVPGRKKGHAQVWTYKAITLTLHNPHGKSGGNTLDPGAVAKIIQKIEEAKVLQEKEQAENEAHENVN